MTSASQRRVGRRVAVATGLVLAFGSVSAVAAPAASAATGRTAEHRRTTTGGTGGRTADGTTTAATSTATTATSPLVDAAGGTSVPAIAAQLGATDLWACGWTGAGVDVALIDTGVSPVPGTGAVVNGPDLSFEGQAGVPRSLDGDGHGTHLASIINGRDADFAVNGACRMNDKANRQFDPRAAAPSSQGFSGIAPGARIVNVKVGDHDGAADITQVIAAIDWVVQHRDTEGRNIRVLAIAYAAADAAGDWRSDPLSHAVDIARRNGIVVVAAGGNDGSTATELAFPAQNPNIVAVNAVDYHGSTNPSDWTVADFSSRGSYRRGPDLLAPGVSIEGLVVPGSVAADENPASIVDGRFIKGSGTSQSTAVVAGLAALLVQRYPEATPAQVKAMLVASAKNVSGAGHTLQGAGVPVPQRLVAVRPSPAVRDPQALTTGTGSIDALRADGTVAFGDVSLRGEIDVQGRPWDAEAWAAAAAAGTSWQDGTWRGSVWSAGPDAAWDIAPWASSWDPSVAWQDLHVDGPEWTGIRWSGIRWSGIRWTGIRWSGIRWSGIRWSGIRWSGIRWSGIRWSGASWR